MSESKFNWVDNPTASGVAICNTDVLNDCLMHLKYDNNSTGYEVGDLVYRMLPTTDASKHLMDGTLFDGNGIFKDFVEYIANLYKTNPLASYFATESEWQASVSTYGVCGKFVYDASANTVRLPKVTGHVEGTLDPNALGDLVEAGLPTLTTNLDGEHSHALYAGDAESGSAFGLGSGRAAGVGGGDNGGTVFYRSTLGNGKQIVSSTAHTHTIQGTADTVQTQSILGYMYIVVATGAKTDIEVDIDNVVTDLNGKVDVSSMVDITDAGATITAMAMPDIENMIQISLPYTAPCDGLLYLYPGAALNAYYAVNVVSGGKQYTVFALTNAQCNYSAANGLVPKGANITLSMGGGTSYFIPLKGAN